MRKVRIALICLSACILGTSCVRTENGETIEESTAHEYAAAQEETNLKENDDPLTKSPVKTENVSVQPEYRENIEPKTDMGISDILIPENTCLSVTPFMALDLERWQLFVSKWYPGGYDGNRTD